MAKVILKILLKTILTMWICGWWFTDFEEDQKCEMIEDFGENEVMIFNLMTLGWTTKFTCVDF